VIEVQALTVQADDAALRVDLKYALRRTGELRNESFVLPAAGGSVP
jgi:hypothetical protein